MQKDIWLTLLLLLLPLSGFGQHFLDEGGEDHTESNILYGRWVKLENPINEFPICYQLWACDKSHLEESEVIKNRLPQGEWGICENYLDPDDQAPNECSRCDVAPPKDLCY